MPTAKTFPLTASYLKFLHDQGIAVSFPGLEPVYEHDFVDHNLLESAAKQPFQGGFGRDFYPTIYDKAACLFFSIAGSQIFHNGNKRTAVLALDQFLLANGIYLLLSNSDIKRLVEKTASYRERGEDHQAVKQNIAKEIRENSVKLIAVRAAKPSAYRNLLRSKKTIRELVASV